MVTAAVAVLTDDEGAALDAAEHVIAAGMKTFVKVGNALLTIRDNRLYRTTYATFDDYCEHRWGLGRNYVNKVIAATEITETIAAAVGTAVPIPQSERQVRELAPLRDQPEAVTAAWTDAVEQSSSDQPTAAEVRAAVDRLNEISDTEPLPAGPRVTPLGQRRRRPLPDALREAVYELRKASERLERLLHDDRFPAHAEVFFTSYDADLATVAGIIGELRPARRRAGRG